MQKFAFCREPAQSVKSPSGSKSVLATDMLAQETLLLIEVRAALQMLSNS